MHALSRASTNDLPPSQTPAVSRIIQVKVKPNAKQSLLEEQPDGSWRASLKSPPVDGKANAELIALLAKHFGCAKRDVEIKAGQSSRLKTVKLPD